MLTYAVLVNMRKMPIPGLFRRIFGEIHYNHVHPTSRWGSRVFERTSPSTGSNYGFLSPASLKMPSSPR